MFSAAQIAPESNSSPSQTSLPAPEDSSIPEFPSPKPERKSGEITTNSSIKLKEVPEVEKSLESNQKQYSPKQSPRSRRTTSKEKLSSSNTSTLTKKDSFKFSLNMKDYFKAASFVKESPSSSSLDYDMFGSDFAMNEAIPPHFEEFELVNHHFYELSDMVSYM